MFTVQVFLSNNFRETAFGYPESDRQHIRDDYILQKEGLMFPGAHSTIYTNEEGEVVGWSDETNAHESYYCDMCGIYHAGDCPPDDDDESESCSWCVGDDEDEPYNLCRMHEAEYEGVSLSELDRKEREERYDQI